MTPVSVIIPAAGKGKRLGGSVSKQFLLLGGIPLFLYAVRTFHAHARIERIIVVVPGSMIDEVGDILRGDGITTKVSVVAGGAQRQDSVWNGLCALNPAPDDLVMIHDAARPFVTGEEISACLTAAETSGAAVLAVHPKDTVKISPDNEFIGETLNRDHLWAVQTPQTFRASLLKKGFEFAQKKGFYGTDDSQLAEMAGIRVKIVEGSYDNIKITTSGDVDLAGEILSRRTREN